MHAGVESLLRLLLRRLPLRACFWPSSIIWFISRVPGSARLASINSPMRRSKPRDAHLDRTKIDTLGPHAAALSIGALQVAILPALDGLDHDTAHRHDDRPAANARRKALQSDVARSAWRTHAPSCTDWQIPNVALLRQGFSIAQLS